MIRRDFITVIAQKCNRMEARRARGNRRSSYFVLQLFIVEGLEFFTKDFVD